MRKEPGKPDRPPRPGLGFKKQRLGPPKRQRIVIKGRAVGPIEDIEIKIESIYQMARLMCTMPEMANIIGISVTRFNDLAQTNNLIGDAIERGYADTRQTLRKTQLELALSGHPSMLMWLGKQYLGQADKVNTETKTEINVTVQRAMDQLNHIPKSALLAARAALRLDNKEATDGVFSDAEAGDGDGGTPV